MAVAKQDVSHLPHAHDVRWANQPEQHLMSRSKGF